MFFFGNTNTLYIILIILAISTMFSGQFSLIDLLLTLPGVLLAITFHEFAHAYAADKLGDDTPRSQGRLNLNPMSHMDPFGLFMLIFAHIGWGKPVEIEPRNFNRNVKMSVAEAIVAAAGPIMNIILAFLFTAINMAIFKFAPQFWATQMGQIIDSLLTACASINIGLGIFNLIPLPPLDGSKIIGGFLPYNIRNKFANYYQIFYMIFVIIWVTGIAGIIISPVIRLVYTGIVRTVSAIFGITVI